MTPIAHARSLILEIREHPDRFLANLGEAERVLRCAAASEPVAADVLTCFGAVLSDLGKHREAADVLRLAVKAGSQDRNTYFNLGVAMASFADHDDAMSYFVKARDFEPSAETWEAYFDPQAQ
jgi:Tfp pilus assembly protein PilF